MRSINIPHTDLSDKYKCKKCGKAIKQRLVVIKESAPQLCYKHYKENR